MSENNLVYNIKSHLLTLDIKNICCKNSFFAGYNAFKSNRTNSLTDDISTYCKNLNNKSYKKKFALETSVDSLGYTVKNSNLCRDENIEIDLASKICPSCSSHFIRGIFLAAGRISQSSGNLHLEIVLPNADTINKIQHILAKTEIPLKHTVRKNELLLYCKKTDTIEDFLSFIGATSFSFQIINEKILSVSRSEANRQKNCDTSNIKRALKASDMQIFAINFLLENDLYELLPHEIKYTAQIRLDNPSANLSEITELHNEKITKSGVNHRLNKIIKIAKKYGL